MVILPSSELPDSAATKHEAQTLMKRIRIAGGGWDGAEGSEVSPWEVKTWIGAVTAVSLAKKGASLPRGLHQVAICGKMLMDCQWLRVSSPRSNIWCDIGCDYEGPLSVEASERTGGGRQKECRVQKLYGHTFIPG